MPPLLPLSPMEGHDMFLNREKCVPVFAHRACICVCVCERNMKSITARILPAWEISKSVCYLRDIQFINLKFAYDWMHLPVTRKQLSKPDYGRLRKFETGSSYNGLIIHQLFTFWVVLWYFPWALFLARGSDKSIKCPISQLKFKRWSVRLSWFLKGCQTVSLIWTRSSHQDNRAFLSVFPPRTFLLPVPSLIRWPKHLSMHTFYSTKITWLKG